MACAVSICMRKVNHEHVLRHHQGHPVQRTGATAGAVRHHPDEDLAAPRAKRPIDAIRLTDHKTGSLWAYMNEKDGTLLRLGSHAGEGGVNDGDPKRILTAICEAFDTQIIETVYKNGVGWVLVPEHQRNIERVQGSQ